jgi:hypothetical protein
MNDNCYPLIDDDSTPDELKAQMILLMLKMRKANTPEKIRDILEGLIKLLDSHERATN